MLHALERRTHRRVDRGYEAALPAGGWPNWVLGNHDQPRIATRVGAAQARVAAMLLLTLRGTPTIYNGDEIGMTDTLIPEAETQDPAEIRDPGKGLGRGSRRTPFPWKPGPGAGFTTAKPWLRVGVDTPLSEQRGDPTSMVNLYHALLSLRNRNDTLAVGSISHITADGPVLSYRRSGDDGTSFVILANISHAPAKAATIPGEIVLSTHGDRIGEQVAETLILRPDEALILGVGWA